MKVGFGVEWLQTVRVFCHALAPFDFEQKITGFSDDLRRPFTSVVHCADHSQLLFGTTVHTEHLFELEVVDHLVVLAQHEERWDRNLGNQQNGLVVPEHVEFDSHPKFEAFLLKARAMQPEEPLVWLGPTLFQL